ncbi:MAG: dehydrogenase (quinone) [Acidimicrobiales bacterium]|nr:dehydrogenase (quinone) [Acidimicrobiales bacterium]
MIFAGDPLLSGHIDLAVVAIVVLKTVLTFALLLVGTMFMVWFERKVVGDLQNRIGPNRAGPFGLLQTLADGVKVFFKEDLIPEQADRVIFKYAPLLSMVPAFITFAVVPIAGDFRHGHSGVVSIFGHRTLLQLADPPIGVLLVLAMSSIAVYGVMLAGWSSGSKYPLLGSVRASAQMVSYEAALGLSVVAVVLVSGTLSTSGIVSAQAPWKWNLWVTGVVPFVIFLISGTAELNRPPFDLVEAEQELVGGYQTEYSGIRFALFYLAEFMNTITMSAIIVTLFLGGPSGPVILGPAWIWGLIWFLLKLLIFLFVFVWFRATLPRFRYDQLMDLGWKALIPLSLGWLLLLTAVRVGDVEGWNPFLVTMVGAVVLVAAYGLLVLAMRAARRNRQLAEELL